VPYKILINLSSFHYSFSYAHFVEKHSNEKEMYEIRVSHVSNSIKGKKRAQMYCRNVHENNNNQIFNSFSFLHISFYVSTTFSCLLQENFSFFFLTLSLPRSILFWMGVFVWFPTQKHMKKIVFDLDIDEAKSLLFFFYLFIFILKIFLCSFEHERKTHGIEMYLGESSIYSIKTQRMCFQSNTHNGFCGISLIIIHFLLHCLPIFIVLNEKLNKITIKIFYNKIMNRHKCESACGWTIKRLTQEKNI
jgi:hypothetical protein